MKSSLHSVLANVDTFVSSAQRLTRQTLGRAETVRIVPYRGWVTPEKAVVIGRTVLSDVGLERSLERLPRLLRVAYERFGTLEPAPVPLRAAWRGQSAVAMSDSGGFVDVSFPVHGAVPSGTTKAELTLGNSGADFGGDAGAGARPAVVDVFGLNPRAAFGVISDIDDTVLETELTNPWKRALQLIYSEQPMRLPFEGIAALYQAFGRAINPMFYVSNAPWNLYAHVVELLDHHEIPKGPLLLRDSRIAERMVSDEPGGPLLVHKQRALRRIVEDHPGLSFVMLGDSSRRDPLRYVEVAEAYPGRVAAIYIRRVHGVLARRGSLEQLRQRAQRAGVELLVAEDTVSIARHAHSRGFVSAAEVGRVREGKRLDEQAPPAELTSLASQPEDGGG